MSRGAGDGENTHMGAALDAAAGEHGACYLRQSCERERHGAAALLVVQVASGSSKLLQASPWTSWAVVRRKLVQRQSCCM